jgi:hypothetical protein
MAKEANNGKKLGAYWIPIDLLEQFSKRAKELKTPMSSIVESLIRDYLAKAPVAAEPAK